MPDKQPGLVTPAGLEDKPVATATLVLFGEPAVADGLAVQPERGGRLDLLLRVQRAGWDRADAIEEAHGGVAEDRRRRNRRSPGRALVVPGGGVLDGFKVAGDALAQGVLPGAVLLAHFDCVVREVTHSEGDDSRGGKRLAIGRQ